MKTAAYLGLFLLVTCHSGDGLAQGHGGPCRDDAWPVRQASIAADLLVAETGDPSWQAQRSDPVPGIQERSTGPKTVSAKIEAVAASAWTVFLHHGGHAGRAAMGLKRKVDVLGPVFGLKWHLDKNFLIDTNILYTPPRGDLRTDRQGKDRGTWGAAMGFRVLFN